MFQDGSKRRPAKVGGPRASERRSGLSRPHERAGTEDSPRTPHERESGGSSPEGPKSGQMRNVVIFPRPCDRCGRRDYTFSSGKPVELPAFTASTRPISGRSPTLEAREKCARETAHRPTPPEFPEENPQTEQGAETFPCTESPGPECAGSFRLLLGSFTSY